MNHTFKTTWMGRLLPVVLLLLLLLLSSAGCGLLQSGNNSLQSTAIALGIQQTSIALTQTALAQPTAVPPTPLPPTQPPLPPTQPPAQPTLPVVAPAPVQPQSATAQPTLPPPPPAQDLDAFMRTANILLFEDFNDQRYRRYVKSTLDDMGLTNVTDTHTALGELKNQFLFNAPPNGWDLVIIAAEHKTRVSGEFYTYATDALKQGSSVILETWYLDKVSRGVIEPLLRECGVRVQRDWGKVGYRNQIMWPLAPGHPVMTEPNNLVSGIFTAVTDYWNFNVDIGDLMERTGEGDAILLTGIKSSDPDHYGTLTVCLQDRFILQTFSTHQLSWEAMRLAWTNYVYNALKARYAFLNP